MSESLKPCPFCNGSVKAAQGYNDITFITCDNCKAVVSFGPRLMGDMAIAAWNRRPENPNDH